ncbi:citrate synthase [Advenella kashmirensis WT001]|uniref:citrate synthase (unknown stereospecificity) n=1 Tax=Advenella kashmirensis (strain DSM 17095 / LMG 22695 / WT001) TaxID=1036672 RepID=I3UAT1_ADVKW|nr:citryl-CoA lyase [Advenella kashmirensis]AFK62119.1 citrate synthase [Advenella kashmirensis WT001]
MLNSQIGGGDAHSISVRGHDLVNDLFNRDFIDVLALELLGQFPTPELKRMLNLFLVSATDHGLTPSALSARLTLHGAPESMQGALAAGLLGAGSRFLGVIEYSARFLRDALPQQESYTDEELRQFAEECVTVNRAAKRKIPGVGHPIHVDGDPRCQRMFEIARDCGFYGNYSRFAVELAAAAARQSGRKIPLNATGAKGAIVLDMGLTPELGKALTMIGRSVGLMAHIIEEQQNPIGQKVWDMASGA